RWLARPAAVLAARHRIGVGRRRPQPSVGTITTADRGANVMAKFPSLSVFFPAYNDAPSLPELIGNTFATLQEHVEDYEVVVINDGSWDNTGEVLEQLRQRHAPHMRVITHPQNRGYGGALRSGFASAVKNWVFYTDGDGQYDPREIPRLLELVRRDTGL